MYLDNTIKHTILITLQHNTLKINLNKKQRKNLLSRKHINLRLSKRHKSYLKIDNH